MYWKLSRLSQSLREQRCGSEVMLPKLQWLLGPKEKQILGGSRSLLSQLKPLKPSTVLTSRKKHSGLAGSDARNMCTSSESREGNQFEHVLLRIKLYVSTRVSTTVKSPLKCPPLFFLFPLFFSSLPCTTISNTYKMMEMSLFSLLFNFPFLKLTRVSWFSFPTGTLVGGSPLFCTLTVVDVRGWDKGLNHILSEFGPRLSPKCKSGRVMNILVLLVPSLPTKKAIANTSDILCMNWSNNLQHICNSDRGAASLVYTCQ